jgi:hypothetical protein
MKKTLLFASMLLALTASVALAGGVNVAWGTVCFTDATDQVAAHATTFACNTNGSAGNRLMTVSFALDNEMTDLVGTEFYILGQSDLPALPDYWKLGIAPSTDCRVGKATFASNLTAVASDVCVDWTGGAGFNAPQWAWNTNKALITLGVAIDASGPYDALPGQEYYAGQVTVLNSKAVGTGACTGCSAGMLFALQNVTAAGLGGRRDDFGSPLAGGNQCLSWNNTTQPCNLPTPARNTTWGQVKSLYR